MFSTIFIAVMLGGLVVALLYGGRLLGPFRDRTCQGKEWHSAFPDVPKNEIREFLSLFASAFAFIDTEKLKFNPNDRILEIYRSKYPHRWMPDAMELETLDKDVEKKYRVTLVPIWTEQITLGELFAHVRKSAPK